MSNWTVTKGQIGKDDLNFHTGTFTRTTSTGGTGTYSAFDILDASQFSGANATAKQNTAIADVGSGPGAILCTPTLSSGRFSSTLPNNVPVIDLRQMTDIVPQVAGSTTDPVRPPVLLMEQRIGEYSTKTLTGTLTFTNGSTSVTGSGTKFTTELSTSTYSSGLCIRLTADGTTAWAAVSSVGSDTSLTLTANYTGAGGTGAGVKLVGQLGMGISAIVSAGTPNTLLAGEYTAYAAIISRSAGSRGLYGANFNLSYSSATSATQGQVIGLEIDINNTSGVDDTTSMTTYGLDINSSGTNQPHAGIFITAKNAAAQFIRGGLIAGWKSVGWFMQGSQDHIQMYTGVATNGNAAISSRNSTNTGYVWRINNDGTGHFPTLLEIGDAAATSRGVYFTSGQSTPRWLTQCNSVAESGGNAGSDFSISRYNDAAALIDSPFYIQRSSGFVGIGTVPAYQFDVSGKVRMSGLMMITHGDVTLANGANVDIVVSSSYTRIVGPSGTFSTSGFAGGVDGAVLHVFNSVAFAWTIKNEDAGDSTAANRITTLTGADVTLRSGTSFATFIYNGPSSRWVLVATN